MGIAALPMGDGSAFRTREFEAVAAYIGLKSAIGVALALLILAAIVALKGVALWRAARNGHKGWFAAMLVVNLLGIPEIAYLLTVGKKRPSAPGREPQGSSPRMP